MVIWFFWGPSLYINFVLSCINSVVYKVEYSYILWWSSSSLLSFSREMFSKVLGSSPRKHFSAVSFNSLSYLIQFSPLANTQGQLPPGSSPAGIEKSTFSPLTSPHRLWHPRPTLCQWQTPPNFSPAVNPYSQPLSWGVPLTQSQRPLGGVTHILTQSHMLLFLGGLCQHPD